MTKRGSRSTAAIVALAIAASVAAGCGDASDATSTTAPPASDPGSTTTLAISGEVTTGAPGSAVDPGVQPFRGETPMAAGVTYQVDGRAGPSVGLLFTASLDDLYGLALPGVFAVASDEAESDTLVTVIDLGMTRAVTDPLGDFASATGLAEIAGLTEPTPDDYLSWFSTRPGVTSGNIMNSEFNGHPACRLDYAVGNLPGAPVCASDGRMCLAWLYLPVGVVHATIEGDTGTLYELTVDDVRLLVDVTDRHGAEELGASIEFVPEAS